MNEEIKEMETMENQVATYDDSCYDEPEEKSNVLKYILAAGITVIGVGLGKKLIKKAKAKKEESNGNNEEEIVEYLRSKGYTVNKLENVVEVEESSEETEE